tara:strand:+ start:5473 stop:6732 length:1260 start_codon:yes stop_codon:yes gene_type:complete
MSIQVYINKEIFDKWKGITINKGLDSISGSFSMTAEYNYSDEKSPFTLSGRIEIFHKDREEDLPKKVMTGYIDRVNTSISGGGLMVEISGRDITGDVIDCTIEHGSKEWSAKAVDIIEEIIKDFNINAISKTEKANSIVSQNAKPDSKASEVLSSIAKKGGFIMITDENGDLNLVSKADGTLSGSLSVGSNGNVLSASHASDYTKRYSKITVLENADVNMNEIETSGGSEPKSYTATDPTMEEENEDQKSKDTAEFFEWVGSGQSDNLFKMNQVFAEIRQEELGITLKKDKIGRYRPLTIISKNNRKNDEGNLKKEANWRMALSRSSVTTMKVKVQGWQNDKDELWRINNLVTCDLSKININTTTMLIKGISFEVGGDGSYTNIELVHEDAYDDTDFNLSDNDKENGDNADLKARLSQL